MSKIIAFPQMGNYGVPINYFLNHVVNSKILDPPKITSKTIELGNKYSPEFVCTPFKYTLGTMIECLDEGANVVVQAGGGCRYGYYSELQEQILKDLGYKFTMVNFVTEGKTNLKKVIKEFLKIEAKPKIWKVVYYGIITRLMIKYMDDLDDYVRQNIGFEIKKGEFEKEMKKILKAFSQVKTIHELKQVYKNGLKKLKQIEINKPDNRLKVGIIGELYTIMEPFSNYFLEKQLAEFNIEIKRFTNVEYLLFQKGKKIKFYLKDAKDYIKYKMGADAADNIARAKYLCENNYDGIIHIKSSFCTPEIGAMPIINKVCHEYKVPVIFFSFDANTSETGIKTRLEAFYDMIEMRKKNETMLSWDRYWINFNKRSNYR